MNTDSVIEFVPLLNFEDKYEIMNKWPFTIRKKDNHYEIKEWINKTSGYVEVYIDNKNVKKHRLIALQFIPNDDPINNYEVDHISHDRTDYHLENLRWCNHSTNCKNKSSSKNISYEFVDKISDNAIVINEYGNNKFDDYYFYDNIFYFYNGINYKKLHINTDKKGYKFVYMNNINNKKVQVFYSKFKKMYDIA